MDAQELIQMIANSEKATPVKCYLSCDKKMDESSYPRIHFYSSNSLYILFGEYEDVKKVLEDYKENIKDFTIENSCRNSAIPLLDIKALNARIEPGAIIRDHVEIGENAVIMMGAVLNVGAVVGKGSMIDMNAVLGGRAIVGNYCHIGAGAVLAGVIEPASANPVVIEDNVVVGANAVVIEGCRVGKNSVVAAGAVVINDVPENVVVAGVPARIIKEKDPKTNAKTELISVLRTL